jgi:general stress protein 26
MLAELKVLTDAESKTMIWRDGDTMYYQGGVTDPDYCVLKFTAHKGRYYSNFASEDFEVQTQAATAYHDLNRWLK